jgi:hypothetical protein
MNNTNQRQILSVKELNEVLQKFQTTNGTSFIGTFSEVDIVFVAGLFLFYNKTQQTLPCPFELDKNSNRKEIHQSYFKQINELYDVDCRVIFENFPYSEPTQTYNPDSYSSSFAPPIYITEDYINCFFGSMQNDNITILKKKYIDRLLTREEYANENEKKYFKQKTTKIIRNLETSAPIYTFIFSVAYHKINPFVNSLQKSINNPPDAIRQIWKFTQEYVHGLHELAKNIIEHSTTKQGMITIRSYDPENIYNSNIKKVLETHVFDFGEKGVYQTLYDNTLQSQAKNKKFEDDLKILETEYRFEDFIYPKEKILYQQLYRDFAHYGLLKFINLIKKYDGKFFASSVRKNSINYREEYKSINCCEDEKEKNIEIGTSYYFEIPFNPNMFSQIETYRNEQRGTYSNTFGIQKLQKIQKIEFRKGIQFRTLIDKEQSQLLDFTLHQYINSLIDRKQEKFLCDNLVREIKELKIKNYYISLNFQDVEFYQSNLLRILVQIQREIPKIPLIVYNLDFDKYKSFIEDNENWFAMVNWKEDGNKIKPYWETGECILFLTYQKLNNENIFYFSDMLYGKNEEEFQAINLDIDKIFPNGMTIERNWKRKNQRYNMADNLQNFFHSGNILLPFDSLLEYNGNPLFVSNIKTVLQNNLLPKKRTIDNTNNLTKYISSEDGYCIPDTHFKIGNKLHSERFYYAKRLFLNSFYTTRLAIYLAIKIKDNLQDDIEKITLVGYEMYSELFLSLIQKFLQEFQFKDVVHFIAQDENETLKFKPKTTYDNFIENDYNEPNNITVIIVPIASTGSTAVKIIHTLKEKKIKSDLKKEKDALNKKEITLQEEENAFTNAKNNSKKIKYFPFSYNVLWAKPDNNDNLGLVEETILIDNQNIRQKGIIELPTKWYKIKDCPLCFDKNQRKPLYETDKSSLTPVLIFDFPKGKLITKNNEIKGCDFNEVKFENSLSYKDTYRNNEFRLYSIDTEKFINENKYKIENWLLEIKNKLNIHPIKKIIIIAPCNESNSSFVNMVNKRVFNLSATIIYHQPETDFIENFNLLYETYLHDSEVEEGVNIFYVDDSVISAKHFFEMYDMVTNSLQNKEMPFTATIVLKDKTHPYIHSRLLQRSGKYFAFVNINQPSNRSLSNNQYLMHEKIRYEFLSKEFALHDVLIKTFDKKAKDLDYEEEKRKENDLKSKREHHTWQFEATHKIYDYFTKPEIVNKIDRIDKIVEFRDEYNKEETTKALLKVLCQYPFILYQPLREKTFEWHNRLINNKIECFNRKLKGNFYTYNDFQDTKFLIRRAVLLGNNIILEIDFIKFIFSVFDYIHNNCLIKYIPSVCEKEITKKRKDLFGYEGEEREIVVIKTYIFIRDFLSLKDKENIKDFSIFLVRNYIELIQKNGWIAVKLNDIFSNLKSIFSSNDVNIYAKQFYRMLQIELANVIDDFTKKIEKEEHYAWRDMYKYTLETKRETMKVINEKFITETLYIKEFFRDEDNNNKLIQNINKYEIVHSLLNLSDNWYTESNHSEYENYLWIKQLLYADYDKKSHLPKEISYDDKIQAIIEKMKGFFPKDEKYPTNKMHSFFVVTDSQNQPYTLFQDNYVLNKFENEYKTHKNQIEQLRKKINDKLKQGENVESDKRNLKEILENPKNKNGEELSYSELITFLNGKEDKQHIAKITIAEYTKIKEKGERNNIENKEAKWRDLYNIDNKTVTINFLTDNEWLLLIRISQFEQDDFKTMGILGFYSKNDFSEDKPENLLPKQLLMLLRRDMCKFIEKHHKNDEFSALKQAEMAKRFAFLAGHGRQTMQRLAKEDKKFRNIIGTMDKLQYLYATKNLHIKHLNLIDNNKTKKIENSSQSELIKSFIPSEINLNDIRELIISYVKEIFQSKNVENQVEIKMFDALDNIDNSYDTAGVVSKINDSFFFNKDILLFIIFEMIINAKKNRWHCINNDNNRSKLCKNFIYIKITKDADNNKLIIEINTTGTKLGNFIDSNGEPQKIKDTINEGNPIKASSQNEGMYLITNILEHLNSENEIKMGDSKIITSDICHFNECINSCEHQCKLYINTVTIIIKEQRE